MGFRSAAPSHPQTTPAGPTFPTPVPPVDYTPPAGLEDALDPTRYKLLVDEAVRVVGQRHAVDRVERGVIHLAGGGASSAVVNLHNVVAAVADLDDEGALLDAVHAHVNTLHDAADARARLEGADFATARPRLVARVYPAAGLAAYADGATLVLREHLPGTYTLLMLDVEGAFASVARDRLEAWGVSADEAFAAAHANAAGADVAVARTAVDLGGGPQDLYLVQDENYAASFALALAAHAPEVLGEHGALVAVPSRALAVVLPLPATAPKDVVERFAEATRRLVGETYRRHPYAVSADLFWLTPAGTFARVTDETGAARTPVGLAGVLGGSQ